jgi:aminobenzoyl-glutamate utilization protein B
MFGRHAMKIEVLAGWRSWRFCLPTASLSGHHHIETRHRADEKFKAVVVDGVETRRKLAQVMNDTVFSFGELAYQEFETSKYGQPAGENGFSLERGCGHALRRRALGLRPSGHRARQRYRLPSKASQGPASPIANRWSRGSGHGEGHTRTSGQHVARLR